MIEATTMKSDPKSMRHDARRHSITIVQVAVAVFLLADPVAAQPGQACAEPAAAAGTSNMSDNACNLLINKGYRDLAAALPLLPADHPMGNGAAVTLASLDRATNLQEATVSTFIIDYAPGGSAMLHRMPASGYVLVHVLSGTIHAFAWQAGVGTYRAGETWAEPAFAYSIATANASARESARALVVLVTDERHPNEQPTAAIQ
jgi:hypothetical protein